MPMHVLIHWVGYIEVILHVYNDDKKVYKG
jgi:hypothetical protein